MTREILFRGKRIDNGEWVEGYFCADAIEQLYGCNTGMDGFIRRFDPEIHKSNMFEVDRETVGQFTGLTDRNGVKIFEGDIIKHTQIYLHGTVESIGYVKWSAAYACWLAGGYTNGRADMYLSDQSYKLEVLGNIYDNPELLEVEE